LSKAWAPKRWSEDEIALRRLGLTLWIALGLLVVLILTLAVFGLPIGSSLKLIWDGASGDKFGVARTLVKATPLALCGLSVVVAWRAGMYNIGMEGQFVIGSVCGAAAAKAFWHLPGAVLNPVILVAAVIGGALYAGIAGALQVYRGVQCVISTILLNFIALQVLGWSVNGPLRQAETTMPQTEKLPEAAMFRHFDPQTDFHVGVFLALAVAIGIYIYLYYTKGGFRLRLVGENANAAKANRIPAGRVQIVAMMISGGLAGLAGAVEYTGMAGMIGSDTSQQWGFLAIPVALLGGLHPLGVVGASVYFGALFAGSENLSRYTDYGSTMVFIIQAAAVLVYIGLKAIIERRQIRPAEAAL
jgi:simple sugar transport system permease protein